MKVIPRTKFRVFTLSGNFITGDLYVGTAGWLEAEGLRQTANFIYNRHDEHYRGPDNLEGSKIEAYMPVM